MDSINHAIHVNGKRLLKRASDTHFAWTHLPETDAEQEMNCGLFYHDRYSNFFIFKIK